jgi:hypothetical protein
MEKFIRIEERLNGELIAINEFCSNNISIFRESTGTCTRLFSKILKGSLERGSMVTIYKGGVK